MFLLNAISPDTLATAWARLVDTLIGGSLGLVAYALWPTWSARSARNDLANLVEAQRAYVRATLNAIADGQRPDDSEIRVLSREARVARTAAEATVARSLSEPATRRIDADQSYGMLAAARRLVQAAHVLRLDAQEERNRRPVPGLAPLAPGLDTARRPSTPRCGPSGGPLAPPPSPRGRRGADGVSSERAATFPIYAGATTRSSDAAARYAADPEGLLLDLDELVDAANGLAERLELPSGPPAQEEVGSPA